MKVIIAGTRDATIDLIQLARIIKRSGFKISRVISGNSGVVDKLGEKYANRLHLRLKRVPADWRKYGPAAGPIRNVLMAEQADALIAIWDGKSSGTANMIKVAQQARLKVFIWLL